LYSTAVLLTPHTPEPTCAALGLMAVGVLVAMRRGKTKRGRE
jgi:MYXO-CTERM domain-containing protein